MPLCSSIRKMSVLLALLLAIVSSGCQIKTEAKPVVREPMAVDEIPEASVFEDKGWRDYRDRDGDSNVVAYRISEDFIEVKFTTGLPYKYSHESAGWDTVERMKALAEAGDGLNAYINTDAKYLYEGYVPPIDCGACSATGRTTCIACMGRGAHYCSMCGGSGRDGCWVCGGSGGKPCVLCSGKGATACAACAGSGRESCYACSGTGSDYFGGICTRCGGRGAATCAFCGGAGGRTCTYCGGDGHDQCVTCAGAGSITCLGCGGYPKTNCAGCSGAGQVVCVTCDGLGSVTP